jgi:hypothetical protein
VPSTEVVGRARGKLQEARHAPYDERSPDISREDVDGFGDTLERRVVEGQDEVLVARERRWVDQKDLVRRRVRLGPIATLKG